VDVCAEPYVICKIPTVVVRIFIDHNLVGIPEPVIAIAEIVRGDVKIEPAEPETARASSANPPNVAATEAAGEPSMFKWMTHVIVGVVASRVVAHPLIVLDINVRSIGMPGPLAMALDRRSRMRWSFVSGGAARGNMPATDLGFGFMLRENRS
jgi:hypothetical protein